MQGADEVSEGPRVGALSVGAGPAGTAAPEPQLLSPDGSPAMILSEYFNWEAAHLMLQILPQRRDIRAPSKEEPTSMIMILVNWLGSVHGDFVWRII